MDSVSIGLLGGRTIHVPAERLAQALLDQNKLRAEQGLQPLINPFTNTHATPRVAKP